MLSSWLLPTVPILLTLTAPLGARQDDAKAADETLVVRAKSLIVRPGEVVENGVLVIEGERILAAGADVSVPEGARELSAEVACAGFVDGWSTLLLDPGSARDLGTAASTRTLDGVDPYRAPYRIDEALGAGVTTARLQAGFSANVGGVGAVVATSTGAPVVLREDACLAVSVGITRGNRSGDVFDRVGEVDRLVGMLEKGRTYRENHVEYRHELEEWEKAIAEARKELEDDFKKAKKKRDKEIEEAKEKGKEFKEEKYKEDKKPKKPKSDPNSDVLAQVVNGELPLVVEVHRVPELRSLLEKTAPFDRLRMVLAGCSEAHVFAEEIAERRLPVLLWPTADPGSRDEFDGYDPTLAGKLAEAGVEVLFGSGGQSSSRDLRLLASQAVGFGLDREAALHALTLGPARAFDVAGHVGTLERGKHADVLLLNGDPLSSTSRVQTVISRGRVVVEQ